MVGGGGGVPSDYFVSTQLQLFCCWGCGCCWAVTIINTSDHIREVVFDASLNFSEKNPDVRTPVLNRPILLAGQNAGHQMDQWRKMLYIATVSDGRHASVGSKVKPSKLSMNLVAQMVW